VKRAFVYTLVAVAWALYAWLGFYIINSPLP